MGTKVKNHIVTRGYIANWKSQNEEEKTGIWYFDIEKKEVIFSPSLKASFAIAKYIYAPKYINDRRDDRLENWFSQFESELCDFVRDQKKESTRKWTSKALKRALSGIISLGYRSEYTVNSVESHIKSKMNLQDDLEIKIHTLNNLYNFIQDRIKFFTSGTAFIIEEENPIFLTGDQPFGDMTPLDPNYPTAVFPLSPTRVMVFSPSVKPQNGDFQIAVAKADKFRHITAFAREA